MEFSSSLTIFNSDTPLLLEKRIKLIGYIEIEGSISKAAKKVPMSYKAAWDAIDAINNLCPTTVVEKSTGGVGGGGAVVTPYGKNLIKTYSTLKKEHEKFLSQLTKMTDFNTGALKSLERFSMQISARNQVQGIVEHIEQGKVNSSVYLKLKSGYTLVSVITNGAIDNLNLQIEDEVVAIFKSSSVLLTTDLSLNISARNKFQGTITDISLGEINSEVLVDIGNGDKIASVITKNATGSLDLKVGDSVSAIIKSSDVMIGK
ncbi:MAG: TOBE domain-containing protein [Arcobacteraceae bacterium]|nr:TOBE domain-containing protein [Arcobacteraceae bacterium]